ncbi:MAG: putative acylglycerol lipase [Acidimicrobiia bacterium]|nr:putative acylglycerol lipase [Acidimicrobiia bacterium]
MHGCGRRGKAPPVDSVAVMAGAEPLSVAGNSLGALVLHGFGGTPATVRPLAHAFLAAGWSVESPRLPGHATTVADMSATGWPDWLAEARRAYQRLARRSSQVVVAGLSMGAALALEVALTEPVAAVLCVNPKVVGESGDTVIDIRGLLEDGMVQLPGTGSDIALPGVVELGYSPTPLAPLLSMWEGLAVLDQRLANGRAPLLIFTSAQDHVVPPAESDHLAARWGGPVERVTLERSYHVATLDYDASLLCERALSFAKQFVTEPTV